MVAQWSAGSTKTFARSNRHVFTGNWHKYKRLRCSISSRGARAAITGRLLYVPHLPGLDGADPPRARVTARSNLFLSPNRWSIFSFALCRMTSQKTTSAAPPPGRALSVNPQYHGLLLQALSSIPLMEPGDTVFWHSDVVHRRRKRTSGEGGYSNVMYISSTPGCAKNTAYLAKQAPAFLTSKTPPDFAADDFEVDFKGRGTEADLTPARPLSTGDSLHSERKRANRRPPWYPPRHNHCAL